MALFFTQVIRIMDQAHVEVTFVRFIFFALFDEHVGQQNVTDQKAQLSMAHNSFGEIVKDSGLDFILLATTIFPLVILSMHFFTWPVNKAYPHRKNTLFAPLAVLPIFLFKSWDVFSLAILVLLENLYITWWSID